MTSMTGRSIKGFVIAGTDTGVGKTEVARALCALLAGKGLRPLPLKPVETGVDQEGPADALALRAACGLGDEVPLDSVCPFQFKLPAAPLVAAEAEGKIVDLLVIERLVVQAAEAQRPLVVELAGGLLVPLARETSRATLEQADAPDRAPVEVLVTNLDLAERLGLPVVLVGRAGLGTLNHCALSVQALAGRGLNVLAIVLNRTRPDDDPTVATNPALLAELTGLPVLGPGPYVADAAARPDRLAVHLSALLRCTVVDTAGARALRSAPSE